MHVGDHAARLRELPSKGVVPTVLTCGWPASTVRCQSSEALYAQRGGWGRQQEDHPPPVLKDAGDAEYEVEAVLAKQVMQQVVTILSKQWVRREALHAPDAIAECGHQQHAPILDVSSELSDWSLL